MQTNPLFSLGNVQVSRREINPELIANMADCATRIHTKDNPDAESWNALADRVSRNDRVESSDLDQLTNLGKACFSYHKKLHADFKASGYKDKAIKAELAEVHVYTKSMDAIKDAMQRANGAAAVGAIAGAGFGPTNVVAAYTAYARLDDSSTKALVDTVQDIRSGNSNSIYDGNKVQGFHRQEIWKQMINMLDHSVAEAKAGRPSEVDAQYYELTNQQIVGKLAESAAAGNKIRVNVDAGRLVAFKGKHVEIDEVPDKLRAMLQLTGAQGDIGVSVYPVPRELGDPGDLMHRKGLRVGDQFLLSGMNANEGSGENVDAGYTIEGPAARRLVQNFARDVGVSSGASNQDIYGEKPLTGFMEGDINMGSRGLIAMFDTLAGPAPAGTSLPHAKSYDELESVAKSYGQKVTDFISVDAATARQMLSEGKALPLSQNGKDQFLAIMNRALDSTRTETNRARLADITAPEGKVSGSTTVGLADLPTEREALMLTAIQDAEKFIYIPAFVMTRTVASMLVAKRDEMKEQGKDLDIRVICDPGVYPDGGTPNEYGVKFLEDAGITVRWANLPRSGWHDRKIHAKELLTDQGEFYGSTNFSNKGLRENWEHSGYVKFDAQDPQSVAQRNSAVEHFLRLWDNESFELNSLEKGKQLRERSKDEKDYLVQADEARYGVVRDIIHGLENVEKESGAFVAAQAQDPKVASRIAELEACGHDDMSATLMAVEEKLGTEAFYDALANLPERRNLESLKR